MNKYFPAVIGVTASKIGSRMSQMMSLIKETIQTMSAFDPAFYLKCYPNLPANKLYACFHFIRHGKAEGRLGSSPLLLSGASKFCGAKETILVISHEASRTGAPILALNICEELNKQFNVIVLLLKDGNLGHFFESTCCNIMKNGTISIAGSAAIKNMVAEIKQQHNIKFSIVNSIESYQVLEALAEHFIPSLLLIHEFLTYTRPVDKFSTALFWAGTTVFSAKIVQENAINMNTMKAIKTTHVLAQGKSFIPQQLGAVDNSRCERLESVYLSSFEAPRDCSAILTNADLEAQTTLSKPFVILGAGTVYYRKGVDLFIATAAEIKRQYPDYTIQMKWVGGNFNPDQDTHYSSFLVDQIERSGLKNCFEFIDEVSDLESLYSITDLFFLSSRLDPLPNVAIDAMSLGIPIICFEDATGIVEILEQDDDAKTCIVPYLSIHDAAKKIIEFYKSPPYCEFIADKMKSLAQKNFNMKDYVSRLIEWSLVECKRSEQEAIDCATLNHTIDFIEHFSAPHATRVDAIRQYVRSWHSQMTSFRKPAPGFNREVYDLHHHSRSRGVEPFADYIRNGKPIGSWQDVVITPAVTTHHSETQLRCALHIHAYYPDLLSDILERLTLNKSKCDLFISTTKNHSEMIRAVLANKKIKHYELRIVPNKGRDIGPLLTEFGQILQQYDVIGHLHTKKSLDVKNTEIINTWVNFLLENLVGGQHRMMDRIMSTFYDEPKLGLVFADDPHLLGWDSNTYEADKLAQQMGLNPLSEGRFSFPVGTMFWARPSALKPLFNLGMTWDSYPDEPLPYDGSSLHAIERLLPAIAAHQGYNQAVTYVPGVTR